MLVEPGTREAYRLGMQANKARKAIAAARLALSAHGRGEDGEGEALAAGERAGALAHAAGLTLTDLDVAVPGLCRSAGWDAAVDAWYDAAEGVQG